MIKQINKLLKLVGFNLVRAKRPKAPKSEAQRVGEFLDEFVGTPRPPYTAKELLNCPLDAKCNQPNPGEVPLSKYQDDYEWKNIPDNPSCAVGKSAPCATVSNPANEPK